MLEDLSRFTHSTVEMRGILQDKIGQRAPGAIPCFPIQNGCKGRMKGQFSKPSYKILMLPQVGISHPKRAVAKNRTTLDDPLTQDTMLLVIFLLSL